MQNFHHKIIYTNIEKEDASSDKGFKLLNENKPSIYINDNIN